MRAALTILAKDLRIEWRTKEGVTTVAVLAVLLLVVFSFAHDPTPEVAPTLAPAVLWTTFVFTGLLGVQRAFLLEREQDCLSGLLAAPIDPGAIYAGKLAGTVVLLATMQAVLVPLVAIMLRADVLPVLPGLLAVLALGNLGFAALSTLFAALAVRTRAREVLLPLLLLPLLSPLVIAAVSATRSVLAGGWSTAGDALGVLIAFDVIFTVAGWLLFAVVVRD